MEKFPSSRSRPRRSAALFALAALAFGPVFHPGFLRAEPPATAEVDPAAPPLAFNENRRVQTVEANGRDVVVNGNRNEITLRGRCRTLTVNGNGNRVTAEIVAVVAVPGNQNQVVWRESAQGEQPRITNLGSGNTVIRQGQ